MGSKTPLESSAAASVRERRDAPVSAIGPRVNVATADDLTGIVAAVGALLTELGGTPPPTSAMIESARMLLEHPRSGPLLVARADEEVVGVLSATWQTAIHVSGRYALIQDLWVAPVWRARALGGALLEALFALMAEQDMTRVEVGLPRESFAGIAATEGFYIHYGFTPLGTRMRRISP